MDKRIIYQNDVGGISIIIPAIGCDLTIDKIAKKDVPNGWPYTIVDASDLPTDRTFRDAWELDNGGIKINVDKAKEVHKARLRLKRKPLLESLDVDYLRALEGKADTSIITTEKQRLRDITKMVDACTTIEEIQAVEL